ncbi:tetratricopeptide repeat protein [Acuticoccus mangrovi]|uniref:Cell division coordinator CpoB n=1 Tax=Acuticoccus mangrovi TaxID=2796142 RepID=A0A934II67_9HYPH|nr:tetratricopeptide repeat protein [Acuticoccus mangrovi]MBJ3776928.1 tetratricopeptide repeat protein [Acuticoccus mangrovi]
MLRSAAMALILAASSASAAVALPRLAAPADRHAAVVEVQQRFLPRLFGGDDQRQSNEADLALRVQQLEEQVRMLTGQVEELTFTLRRMERERPQAPDQHSDAGRPGPGAPPRSLGSLPASGATAPRPGTGGPVDLSALNRNLDAAARAVDEPVPAATTATPAGNPALQEVRSLQGSGRYAMAAQQAREVLADNPTGPVAGEARFLLGEAMLAQGDYRNAASVFLENYTTDPNGAHAPASLLRLGSALNGLGEREAACSSLAEFFGAYPNAAEDLKAAARREQQAAHCV